jgi:exodeoxyribonuclease V beta subunit
MSENPFDYKIYELENRVTLIEASAGTGKTFSIAMLVLRLIIEKGTPIEKILMVTFTNAAVAELETRIRKFIKIAYKIETDENYKPKTNEEKQIKELIQNLNGFDIENRLKAAISNLDESNIKTIHSFCQSVLTEYAFETKQAYGLTLMNDVSDVIEEGVREFWRSHIATLDLEILEEIGNEIKFKDFVEVVKADFNGIKLKEDCVYDFFIVKENLLNQAKLLFNKYTEVDVRNSEIHQKNVWVRYLEDFEIFSSKLSSTTTANILETFSDIKELLDEVKLLPIKKVNDLQHKCIEECRDKINTFLNERKLISTDSLIKNVHNAVTTNSDLVKFLKEKFDAVFIDEFQDTDKLQYEIFSTLFSNDTILFYIGDPKQSIYGWRQADINTYLEAKSKANVVKINTNFRSTPNIIGAMNDFFNNDINPFENANVENQDKSINYISVAASEDKTNSTLKDDQINFSPLTVYSGISEENKIAEATALSIFNLLHENKAQLNGASVLSKNIAVLVRTGKQGKVIETKLQKYGIPVVTSGQEKVLKSQEAVDISYILDTILNISMNNINKALLNNFTALNSSELPNLSDDDKKKIVQNFRELKSEWDNSGIYAMLLQYLDIFNVKNYLSKENGHRSLANFYQIGEILQRQEIQKKLSKNELVNFLKKAIKDNDNNENEEDKQRIETDENAVQIVTIHKSKGLEYDIVYAPFLDLKVSDNPLDDHKNWRFFKFRNTANEYVINHRKQFDASEQQLWEMQEKQENARLVYVALTRAKYNCFLFHDESENSILLKHLESRSASIKIEDFDWEYYKFLKSEKYSVQKEKKEVCSEVEFAVDEKLKVNDRNWRKMSYSYLAGTHTSSKKDLTNTNYSEEQDYEDFVFNRLPKGSHVGNMLHDIFEFIDFTNAEKWDKIIENSVKRYLPKADEQFISDVRKLLQTVVNTELTICKQRFKLKDVDRKNRVSELEFDFKTDEFELEKLKDIPVSQGLEIHLKKDQGNDSDNKIQGILTGLVDLFFLHNGRYYILDWKSNFLGDVIDNYAEPNLTAAMNENNYHLQYLIYALAVKKYLESKIVNFNYEEQFGGVIYLFLRGVRKGKPNGIYTTKPDMQIIIKLESILKTQH